MVRERGSGITPERVVALLKKEVSEKSILAVSKATGLGLAAIGRYLKGIGEPTTATLEKLADYFGVSVAELRGEKELYKLDFNRDEMVSYFKNIAVEISTPYETIKQVGISIVLLIQQGASDEQILGEINGWKRKLLEIDAEKSKGPVKLEPSGLSEKLGMDPTKVLQRLEHIGVPTKKNLKP